MQPKHRCCARHSCNEFYSLPLLFLLCRKMTAQVFFSSISLRGLYSPLGSPPLESFMIPRLQQRYFFKIDQKWRSVLALTILLIVFDGMVPSLCSAPTKNYKGESIERQFHLFSCSEIHEIFDWEFCVAIPCCFLSKNQLVNVLLPRSYPSIMLNIPFLILFAFIYSWVYFLNTHFQNLLWFV